MRQLAVVQVFDDLVERQGNSGPGTREPKLMADRPVQRLTPETSSQAADPPSDSLSLLPVRLCFLSNRLQRLSDRGVYSTLLSHFQDHLKNLQMSWIIFLSLTFREAFTILPPEGS